MEASKAVIDNGSLTIDAATGFGPRVLGLTPRDGTNLFATLPESGIDLGDGRRFSFRGGHRLWLAPEIPEITYEPDDDPVTVVTGQRTLSVSGVVAGVRKTIGIELAEDAPTAAVSHNVTNVGDGPVEIALWAITQFRPGGTAMLPLDDVADDAGYRAASQVVGWRYTDWSALEAGPNNTLCLRGSRKTPTKIGTALIRGWLAYQIDGWLFAKYANTKESPIDLGATGQIYAGAEFLELETLGSVVTLEPGAAAEHREVWQVWPAPDSIADAIDLVQGAGP